LPPAARWAIVHYTTPTARNGPAAGAPSPAALPRRTGPGLLRLGLTSANRPFYEVCSESLRRAAVLPILPAVLGCYQVSPFRPQPLVRPSPGQRRAILRVGKEPACSIAPPRATDTVTSPHADTPTRWGVAGPGGRADRRERLARRPSPDRTDQVRGVRRCDGGEEVGCPQRGRRADHRRGHRSPVRARPGSVPRLAPQARD
jgi:hypothetical protein